MPVYLMRRLLGWHTMSFIRDADTQHFLEDVLRTRTTSGRGALDRPGEAQPRLPRLPGHRGAKVKLSNASSARSLPRVAGEAGCSPLAPRVRGLIRPLVDKLEACLDGLLEKAAMTPDQIDAVVLTGGSSLIPCISVLFEGASGRRSCAGATRSARWPRGWRRRPGRRDGGVNSASSG